MTTLLSVIARAGLVFVSPNFITLANVTTCRTGKCRHFDRVIQDCFNRHFTHTFRCYFSKNYLDPQHFRASSYEPGQPGWLASPLASPRHSPRLATLSFVKILLCSYERPGWPGYRDLGFCDQDLGNRDENFLI